MTLFGEIVEPSSRTIWEDWDDIIPENNDINLQWQNQVEINEEIQSFYLLDGKYFKHFIDITSQQLQLVNKINKIDLSLYKIEALPKYICTVKDYDMVLSSEIVRMLTPYIESSKNVIAVKIDSISEYQSNLLNIQPCVRGIYSSKASIITEFEYPKLEQPNILSGVSAGVITLREQLDLMGVAIICYVEYTEDYQVKEIQKILNKLGIGSISQSGFIDIINSNLYI